jgi:hypothetical protein
VVGHRRDRRHLVARQRAAEAHADLPAVADHRDVVVVAHLLGLGAADDEVVQRVVDDARHEVGLARALLAAERVGHRARLVEHEDDERRVGARDLCGVCHREV